ncbi:MAG: hypothetical protein ACFFB3_10145, partial [Candidatus Hodarchaeota archaeon]
KEKGIHGITIMTDVGTGVEHSVQVLIRYVDIIQQKYLGFWKQIQGFRSKKKAAKINMLNYMADEIAEDFANKVNELLEVRRGLGGTGNETQGISVGKAVPDMFRTAYLTHGGSGTHNQLALWSEIIRPGQEKYACWEKDASRKAIFRGENGRFKLRNVDNGGMLEKNRQVIIQIRDLTLKLRKTMQDGLIGSMAWRNAIRQAIYERRFILRAGISEVSVEDLILGEASDAEIGASVAKVRNLRTIENENPKEMTKYIDKYPETFLRSMGQEELYAHIVHAVWGKVLNQISSNCNCTILDRLRRIVSEEKSRWKLVQNLSISNLSGRSRDFAGYWAIDHIEVYHKKSTNDYALVAIQDKIPGSRSRFLLGNDARKAHQFLANLIAEMRTETGELWTSSDGLFKMLNSDEIERLKAIEKLAREGKVRQNFCVLRHMHNPSIAGVDLNIHVWKPCTTRIRDVIDELIESGGDYGVFGRQILMTMNALEQIGEDISEDLMILNRIYWTNDIQFGKPRSSQELIKDMLDVVRYTAERIIKQLKEKTMHLSQAEITLAYNKLAEIYGKLDFLVELQGKLRLNYNSSCLAMHVSQTTDRVPKTIAVRGNSSSPVELH